MPAYTLVSSVIAFGGGRKGGESTSGDPLIGTVFLSIMGLFFLLSVLFPRVIKPGHWGKSGSNGAPLSRYSSFSWFLIAATWIVMINWKDGEGFGFIFMFAAFINMMFAGHRDHCAHDPARRSMSSSTNLVVIRRKLVFAGMIAPIALLLCGIFSSPGGIGQVLLAIAISSILAALVYIIYRQWLGPVMILDDHLVSDRMHLGVRGIRDIQLVGGHLEITTQEGVPYRIDMSGCYAGDILRFIAEVERRSHTANAQPAGHS